MQRAFTSRRRRLAPIAVFVLLGLQAAVIPARAATFGVDVSTQDTQVHVGDSVEYRFEVTPGDVRANGLDVSGSLCDSDPGYASGDANGDDWLDPGETFVYTCSHVVDELGGVITNSATATATPDGGGAAYSASDSVGVEVFYSGIRLTADIAPQPLLIGATIIYFFGVTNDGTNPLSEVVVTSSDCLSAMTGPTGDDGDDGLIAPDGMEFWSYRCDGPTVAATDTAFHVEGHVTAKDAIGKVLEATDDGDTVVVHPSMTFVSTTTMTTARPGDTITFKYRLTNTGDTHVGSVFVETTACDEGTLIYGDDGVISGLRPGDVWNGSCTHKVTEPIGATVTNVFTFIGDGGITLRYTAQSSVAIAATTSTQAPTPTPRPSRAAVATPTPAGPSASPVGSLAPSVSPGATIVATAIPGATPVLVETPAPAPAATAGPLTPAADEGASPIALLLLLGAIVAVAAGGGFALWRRRAAGGGAGGPI